MHAFLSVALTLSLIGYSDPQPTSRSIPRFDIKTECDLAIGLPGCVEMEHAALGALKFWWKRVRNREAKTSCIAEVRQASTLRYTRLMSCIAFRTHLPRSQLASEAAEKTATT